MWDSLIYRISIMCGGFCGNSIWKNEWANTLEPEEYSNFPGSEFIDEPCKPGENTYYLKHVYASPDHLCPTCQFKKDILEVILNKLQVLVEASDTYLLHHLVQEIKKDSGPYSIKSEVILNHYNNIFNKWINNYNEEVQRSQLKGFRKCFFNLYEQVGKN